MSYSVLPLPDGSHPDLLSRGLPFLLLPQCKSAAALDCTNVGPRGCHLGIGLHYLQQEPEWTPTLHLLAQHPGSSDHIGHLWANSVWIGPAVSTANKDFISGSAPEMPHRVRTDSLLAGYFYCSTGHLLWLVSGPDQRRGVVLMPGIGLLSSPGNCEPDF